MHVNAYDEKIYGLPGVSERNMAECHLACSIAEIARMLLDSLAASRSGSGIANMGKAPA